MGRRVMKQSPHGRNGFEKANGALVQLRKLIPRSDLFYLRVEMPSGILCQGAEERNNKTAIAQITRLVVKVCRQLHAIMMNVQAEVRSTWKLAQQLSPHWLRFSQPACVSCLLFQTPSQVVTN